jgi:hypothetical protein
VTYASKVYHKQGGTTLVVSSGGTLSVESGGSFVVPVTVLGVADVATSIPASGFATIVASTTAPNYTLSAPVAGAVCYLRVESNTPSGTATVTTTAAFDAAGSKNKLKVNAADDAVTLVGVSSTGWAIVSNVGSVATTSG